MVTSVQAKALATSTQAPVCASMDFPGFRVTQRRLARPVRFTLLSRVPGTASVLREYAAVAVNGTASRVILNALSEMAKFVQLGAAVTEPQASACAFKVDLE